MAHVIPNVLSDLGKIVPILNNSSWFQKEVSNAVNFSENMKKLQDSFVMLQAVVEDAERKQVKSKAVQIWLEQLKKVSYAADDLLDEWNTEKQKSEMRETGEIPLAKKVPRFFSSASDSVIRFILQEDNVHRVVKILEQLDQIAKGKTQFDFSDIKIETIVERREPISSFVNTEEIFGREGDKKIILRELLSEGSSQGSGVPVICIAGTGGFGKTTLSQFVYNSDEVKKKFEKKMWVCVSQPFDMEKVAREIIGQIGGRVPDSGEGWESLHKNLSDAVKGKLYLLVLDDVWEYKDEIWRQLKFSLNGGSQGSRVLVTTRNRSVGQKMGSAFTHIMNGLSNDDCWKLFKHRSLQGREDPERFHTIGRRLSDRCKGVPLAARVLSSLMLQKASEQDWRNVLDSSIWELTKEVNGDGFLPELLFSYYALPPVLKHCFVYCAIFREDMRIEKNQVVKLWMAEGFMGYNGMDNLEDKGAGYFDELAMRSFFQDTETDAEGNIASCKMHDLVREFALFLLNGPEVFHPCRYTYGKDIGNFSTIELENLRTVIKPLDFRVSSESFKKGLVNLRAFELWRYSGPHKKLPDEVGKLLHLRYLCLTGADISILPETVCDLLNLQTLGLNQCRKLKSLPERMGELSNLRHLELKETDALDSLPEGIGKLSHLRTLSKFIVGAEVNMLKIGVLKHLRHLQGSLEITGLGNIVNVNEALQAELKMKENLRKLAFQFDEDHDRYREMEIVLRDLEPPPGLKDLVIGCYPGHKFPFWISSLSKLISLKLNMFNACVDLPCLGKLPFLKKLSLCSSTSVERLGTVFYGVDSECDGTDIFPRLEKLHFEEMPNLIVWEFPLVNNRRLMPRLSDLKIVSCPKLDKLPFQADEVVSPDLIELHKDDLRIEDCPKQKQLPFRAHEDVFSDLRKLHIEGCSSRLLVGVGMLKSLNELRIGNLKGVQCTDLDREVSEISLESKLQVLKIENIDTWETWSLPLGNDTDVFNNLSEVHIKSCKSFRALPALGGLKSLVTLAISDLQSVKHVGLEFLGMSNPNERRSTSFPKLKKLEFKNMPEWEEWVVPFQNKDTEFFPNLVYLVIKECNKLVKLPALGKLKSLEHLTLEALNSVEHLGREFVGISSNDNMVEDAGSITVFPKLKILDIREMAKWKGKEEMMETDQVGPIQVMPCLQGLRLDHCRELVVVPSYMFSESLRMLWMDTCPKLEGPQPYLPSLLDWLRLGGDLGDFTKPLPVNGNSNIGHVNFSGSDCEVLPEGFNQLTAIQDLEIEKCHYLDFTPEDFTRLSTLKTLTINDCSLLSESCRRGENWSTTSRPPRIRINEEEIALEYGLNIEQLQDPDEHRTDEEDITRCFCWRNPMFLFGKVVLACSSSFRLSDSGDFNEEQS